MWWVPGGSKLLHPPVGGFWGGQTWVPDGSKGGFQGARTQVPDGRKPPECLPNPQEAAQP